MTSIAPAWGIDAGWQYINNSNISIINASLDGLRHSAGYTSNHPGFAYTIGMLMLLILVFGIIWLRSQKVYAASVGTLLMLLLLYYFNLLELIYIGSIASIMIVLMAFEFIYNWWNND